MNENPWKTNKPWIQTYTGEKFYLLDPRVELIHLWDIAHPLSLIPRFNGHAKNPLSIAAHSLVTWDLIRFAYTDNNENDSGWALVHDGPEAYIHDISSPLKSSGLFEGYKELEKTKYQPLFAQKFRLSPVIPTIVKSADLIALAAEAESTLTMWPLDNWTAEVRELHEREDIGITVDYAKELIAEYQRYTPAAIEEMFYEAMVELENR